MSQDPWWRDAACAEIGSDLFFVARGQSVLDAKRVCEQCPVRVQCLADALVSDVEYGIFGGFARPARIGIRIPVERGGDPIRVAEAAIEGDRKRRPRAAWR